MKRTPLKRKTPLRRGNVATKVCRGVQNDSKPRKIKVRLATVSKARKVQLELYFAATKAAKEADHRCQRCFCVSEALDAHHPYGRSGSWLHHFILLCRPCHEWVHENSNEAYAEGWLQPEYKGYVRTQHKTPWSKIYTPAQWDVTTIQQREGPAEKRIAAQHASVDWRQGVNQNAAFLNVSPDALRRYMERHNIPIPDLRKNKHIKDKKI